MSPNPEMPAPPPATRPGATRSQESKLGSAATPLGVRSMLVGSITWGVLLLVCALGGLAVALLSDNRAIAAPLAGLMLLVFFGSAVPFGFGTSYGVRAASREPKLMAFLGGGINGCGLLTILFVLLAIVVETLAG